MGGSNATRDNSMSTHFFPELGSLPGVPGQLFAGVRVDIADDGTITTQPLAQHPAFEPAAPAPPTAPDESPAPIEEDDRKRTRPRV